MNNSTYFKDKVAIVTGASSGIGLATATLLAKYQAKVVLAARSDDKLEELSRELSKQTEVLSVRTDVSVREDCRNLIEKTVERFGKIGRCRLLRRRGLFYRRFRLFRRNKFVVKADDRSAIRAESRSCTLLKLL